MVEGSLTWTGVTFWLCIGVDSDAEQEQRKGVMRSRRQKVDQAVGFCSPSSFPYRGSPS